VKFPPVKEIASKNASTDFQNFCWLVSKIGAKSAVFFGLEGTLLPCFLSSSHACKGLVNRLLPSLNLETPYGDVNDANDDWSKHHDSSPLEKRKGNTSSLE